MPAPPDLGRLSGKAFDRRELLEPIRHSLFRPAERLDDDRIARVEAARVIAVVRDGVGRGRGRLIAKSFQRPKGRPPAPLDTGGSAGDLLASLPPGPGVELAHDEAGRLQSRAGCSTRLSGGCHRSYDDWLVAQHRSVGGRRETFRRLSTV
jgi:hypothetical protein